MEELLSIQQASQWATEYLGKKVTTSNISYLIQYGRIRKIGDNGTTKISKEELIHYYQSYNRSRAVTWKDQLGEDLKWYYHLSNIKRLKRQSMFIGSILNKGKFIPNL